MSQTETRKLDGEERGEELKELVDKLVGDGVVGITPSHIDEEENVVEFYDIGTDFPASWSLADVADFAADWMRIARTVYYEVGDQPGEVLVEIDVESYRESIEEAAS